jgi:hypothetical protein
MSKPMLHYKVDKETFKKHMKQNKAVITRNDLQPFYML